MRWFLALPVISMLALPVAACAQDQQAQQAPDSTGAPAGQYQPGTLPPEPPVIEPPLPGQAQPGDADNMAPPPGPDDGQPPMAGQAQPGQADNMAPPPGPDAGQPPPPPGAYGAPPAAYGAPDGAGAYPAAPHDHDAEMMQKFQVRFETANVTHDGRLTREQAEAGNMRAIVKHFSQIDTQHLGYVTLNQVMAWKMDQMAQQMQRRAAALRAQPGAPQGQ